MKLLVTGFVQVFFVAANTYLIAQRLYLGIFVAAFMISIVWSWNVKRVAFGTIKERFIYSLGAALGSVCGVLAMDLLIKYF